MPKGKSKKRKEKAPVLVVDSASPDEDSGSVTSSLDACSVLSEEVGLVPGGGGEEVDAEEDFEFHMAELVDQLTNKNSRTRLEAISSLNKILATKLVTENLMERKETLLEIISRGLRKAQGQERCRLARLAMLIVLQLGLEYPDFQQNLHPLATQLAQDPTISPADRAEVITMLGFTTFIQAADILEVEHTMLMFEELFEKSRQEAIVTAAVQSWTLLLSIAPDHRIPTIFTRLLPVLNKLLERVELKLRLAVGMGVALLFELARDCQRESSIALLDSSSGTNSYALIEQLATESNRHTARKDRNQTRSCFRDILYSLDDGSMPEKSVKLGMEVLSLDSWARVCQYNTFRELLGSGITSHFKLNELLRDIFQMGPAPIERVETKGSRLERKYLNAAVAKHRTQCRGKQRDKRAVL